MTAPFVVQSSALFPTELKNTFFLIVSSVKHKICIYFNQNILPMLKWKSPFLFKNNQNTFFMHAINCNQSPCNIMSRDETQAFT